MTSELYDQPANRFVMSFLGPVSQVGEDLVRPHAEQLELVEGASGWVRTTRRTAGPP